LGRPPNCSTMTRPLRGQPVPDGEADQFVVMLFKRCEADAPTRIEAIQFIENIQQTVHAHGGKIQVRTQRPLEWEVFDGRDNFVEPNHLNPAIFDFNAMVVAGFRSTDDVHVWWSSDEIFQLLKYRSCIEKLGIFVVEGLQACFDVNSQTKVAFGERLILMEFMSMQAFKPTQQYVDAYRLFSEKAITEIGMDCNLIFAESVGGVLMNEFPLDAVCASSWRLKSDAHFFYDSDIYQHKLMALRKDFTRSCVICMPMIDEKFELPKSAKALPRLRN